MLLDKINILLVEAKEPSINDIKKFIKSTRTWFDEDDDDDDMLVYTTRKHGNVGTEKIGDKDWKEALRLKKLLLKKFNVNVFLEAVDEWVTIEILLPQHRLFKG
jgi:hypothetical protein